MAPERVTALALLDTFLGPEPQISRGQIYRPDGCHCGGQGDFRNRCSTSSCRCSLRRPPQSGLPALPAAFRVKLRNWDADRLLDTVLPIGRMLFGRRDARGDLRDLPMPKLVLTGSEDIPRPAHEGQQMAAILDCPFVEIRDAGHISTLEAPQAVNDPAHAFSCRCFRHRRKDASLGRLIDIRSGRIAGRPPAVVWRCFRRGWKQKSSPVFEQVQRLSVRIKYRQYLQNSDEAHHM